MVFLSECVCVCGGSVPERLSLLKHSSYVPSVSCAVSSLHSHGQISDGKESGTGRSGCKGHARGGCAHKHMHEF